MGGFGTAINALNLIASISEIAGFSWNRKSSWDDEQPSLTLRIDVALEFAPEQIDYVIESLDLDMTDELRASLEAVLHSLKQGQEKNRSGKN